MRALAALIIFSFSWGVRLTAHAEMSAVKVSVFVKSVDQKSVTIRLDQREITLPRSLIRNDRLRAGSAIVITLHGDEIRYLFKNVATAESGRRPASVNNPSRR